MAILRSNIKQREINVLDEQLSGNDLNRLVNNYLNAEKSLLDIINTFTLEGKDVDAITLTESTIKQYIRVMISVRNIIAKDKNLSLEHIDDFRQWISDIFDDVISIYSDEKVISKGLFYTFIKYIFAHRKEQKASIDLINRKIDEYNMAIINKYDFEVTVLLSGKKFTIPLSRFEDFEFAQKFNFVNMYAAALKELNDRRPKDKLLVDYFALMVDYVFEKRKSFRHAAEKFAWFNKGNVLDIEEFEMEILKLIKSIRDIL